TIERDTTTGSIDISYDTTNSYADGNIREYVFATNTYTTQLTWDLYIKIYTDAVQISTGIAYNTGDPIEVASAQRKVNLTDVSGTTNYICIKYLEVDTDPETHPRTGLQVYSRIQDSFTIVVRTALSEIQSDEELLASTLHTGVFPLVITDRRTYIPSDNTLWDAYTNRNVILIGESVQAALSINDCVYYNPTNAQWEKASSTNSPKGILTASGEVTLFGQKTGLSGLTANTKYYMDNTGNLTTTVTSIKMGNTKSADTLLVDIDISNKISSIKLVSSTDYTILDDDGFDVIEVTTGAVDRNITLPTLADNQGRILTIKKLDSGIGQVDVIGEG
ncbi:hypothetical protein LCGC14_3167920, partial [marine sediment metagenome]